MGKIAEIQKILGVVQDDLWGAKSQAALDALAKKQEGTHLVWASSFADPADVKAFQKCKATGKSDVQCFKVGDNGIGKWGDDTTTDVPMCALPYEDWEKLKNPRGRKVLVQRGVDSVVCELRDTMPHKENIKNGAGIDLNPAACKALGLAPPVKTQVIWSFV